MKKVLLFVLIIIAVLSALILAAKGIYFAVNRENAKKYNLTEPDNSNLPTECQPVEDGYVQLSAVKMHYVKYGTSGHPMVLIHGNGGSTDSMIGVAKYMANDYVVYCIDSRCQGKSSDPGVISYELMAGDVAEFIEIMGLYKPYVMGHSDGGMVTLALAANYPDVPGVCVSTGANSNPKKFKFWFTLGVAVNNLFYKDKLNDLMLTMPDFTPEYLSRITVPTYIIAGEKDIMPLSDSVYIAKQIKNSEIAIVKGSTHSGYIGDGRAYVLGKYFFDKYALD